MIVPLHDLQEVDSRAWMKKLILCSNAMEENARLNRAINTNTTTNTIHNNNYNPTSNTKKWPNNNISSKSAPKLSPKQDEHIPYLVR